MIKIMEKKRVRTQQAILSSALELITEYGFEQTSMEAIAQKAEIATGTLYNYYPSKSFLLIAIFDNLTNELLSQLPKRSSLKFCEKTALADLGNLLHYFCEFIFLFPKKIMRQIIGQMFMLETKDISKLASQDMQIIGAIIPILQEMRDAGFLSSSIDITQTATLIYGSALMQHQAYISLPKMSKKTLKSNISDQLSIIFFGLLLRK